MKKRTNADTVLDLFQYKSSLTESQWLLGLAKGIVKRREVEEGVVAAPKRKVVRKKKSIPEKILDELDSRIKEL